jgi:hypothetical protein
MKIRLSIHRCPLLLSHRACELWSSICLYGGARRARPREEGFRRLRGPRAPERIRDLRQSPWVQAWTPPRPQLRQVRRHAPFFRSGAGRHYFLRSPPEYLDSAPLYALCYFKIALFGSPFLILQSIIGCVYSRSVQSFLAFSPIERRKELLVGLFDSRLSSTISNLGCYINRWGLI